MPIQPDVNHPKGMSVLNTCRRLARGLHTTWDVVGVCLVALILVELSLRLLSVVKDKWIDPPWVNHGVFQDASAEYQAKPWVPQYESEYSASWIPEWHSYVYWRRPSHRGDYINIDSNGVRRTWSAPVADGENTSSRRRVFVFGGSTIWGTGARDDYTIPSFIAKQLADAGVKAEVTNYGESAYVTTQEVLTLMLRLAEGDIPDAVVFYDGYNDTFAAYQNGVAGIPQNEFNRRAEFRLLNEPDRLKREFVKQLPAEFPGLLRLAHAARRRIGFKELSPEERPTINAPTDSLVQDVIRNYEANIKTVQALGDAYGFTCHFFWQPAVVTKEHLSSTEVSWTQRPAPWKDFFFSVYGEVQKTDSLEKNARFQDLSSIFDDVDTTVYIDWAHVTEEANETIAQHMSQKLIPLLREQTTTSTDKGTRLR
jgi:lysophospholipase L1-like esterase